MFVIKLIIGHIFYTQEIPSAKHSLFTKCKIVFPYPLLTHKNNVHTTWDKTKTTHN